MLKNSGMPYTKLQTIFTLDSVSPLIIKSGTYVPIGWHSLLINVTNIYQNYVHINVYVGLKFFKKYLNYSCPHFPPLLSSALPTPNHPTSFLLLLPLVFVHWSFIYAP